MYDVQNAIHTKTRVFVHDLYDFYFSKDSSKHHNLRVFLPEYCSYMSLLNALSWANPEGVESGTHPLENHKWQWFPYMRLKSYSHVTRRF